MSGAALFEELTSRGVQLWTVGTELRCRGPKRALTPEVLAQLKEHKPEIIERLRTGTNLRTTDLTNLSEATPLRCIHGTTEEKCAVCSGYVRWLIADEGRLRMAQINPEAARREFWQMVRGAG